MLGNNQLDVDHGDSLMVLAKYYMNKIVLNYKF